MEVLEYEPNRMLAMLIHDGPMEMHGRTTFEALNDHQTKITISVNIPWMDESADTTMLISNLERSAQIRKQLMESEIPA
jgi:hypothetical protein